MIKLGKGKNKKVELSLLVHPQWLAGNRSDARRTHRMAVPRRMTAVSTARWIMSEHAKIRLLEVRGTLPDRSHLPGQQSVTFRTERRNRAEESHYACAACGTVQDVLDTVRGYRQDRSNGRPTAVQGYSPNARDQGYPYKDASSRHSANIIAAQYDAARWNGMREGQEIYLRLLANSNELPYGFMTHHCNGGIRQSWVHPLVDHV